MSNRKRKYKQIGGSWDGNKHRGLECDGTRHWNVFARPKGRFYSSQCNCAEAAFIRLYRWACTS